MASGAIFTHTHPRRASFCDYSFLIPGMTQSRRATPGYEVVGGPGVSSQMCVVTFNQYSTALFGPFLCLGSSSLELFCPACFKKPFRLLGFMWDWILCIKRCSARFEGEMTGQSPQNRGAKTAPHKQRNKRGVICLYAEAKNVRSDAKTRS